MVYVQRATPKDVLVTETTHSNTSMITLEDGIDDKVSNAHYEPGESSSSAAEPNKSNSSSSKPTRAQQLLNILDDLDTAMETPNSERKKLGKLYSTMPILKPERKKSSEGLTDMRNATFPNAAVAINKAVVSSPFDTALRNHIKRVHLDYGLNFQSSPTSETMRRAQSVPNDVLETKWAEGSAKSFRNSVFEPLHKPVRKNSIDTPSPSSSEHKKNEVFNTLTQGRNNMQLAASASGTQSEHRRTFSLSKPAFQSTLIEAVAIDILSKPVRRSSINTGSMMTQ